MKAPKAVWVIVHDEACGNPDQVAYKARQAAEKEIAGWCIVCGECESAKYVLAPKKGKK